MRVLTGLQPSGKLHIGNYFASIKQMVDMQEQNEMFMFIANYHAMTSLSEAKALKQNTFEAACAFLALGINPNKSIFWVQSDVKDVLELYWVLSQHTPMGLLERAHSYKDKVAKGLSSHHGLFSYPVLMAADILLYNAQVVPVGKDQIQHAEIARDIAIKFNNEHGEKMSKSYGNTIDIFADAKTLKKQISSIVTDGTPLEEPKQWQNCNVYNIAKLFLDESGQKELQARYERGGEGHGHFKAYLNELIWDYFKDAREKFEHYQNNPDEVSGILEIGAKKASNVAQTTIKKVREAVGIY